MYVLYVRSTRQILAIAEGSGVKVWTEEHFRRKWRWAGQIARRNDECWVKRVTMWRDAQWQSIVRTLADRPKRPSRRRWMKFEDQLRRYKESAGGLSWAQEALDETAWNTEVEIFTSWAVSRAV